ncbi:leucine-rich repeat protein [Lachnoclostridium phytofermentans]|uniref:Leucine-rich repeat domain-containing protein n=1 Tax=Lachnoclostridium phytofermentans (strain ATCC 700394 / DSM 18823 / ISDg) TaxID=357809 RepID=A9KLJ4_LACP7|nr:leucine-rich repeat protein [Lachnoclostridium phytofermentans]ABX41323.1 hypothetical protein Cphy_0939 [Lachnoclostridium phytofermentans ISDg]
MKRIKSLHMAKCILFLFIMVFIILMNTQSVKASESKNYEVKGHILYLYNNNITTQECEDIANTKGINQATISTSVVNFIGMPVWNTIKELHITKEVEKISIDHYLTALQKVFPNLEAIYVDEDNPSYKSIDGVLYSKDGTKLISYPMKKGANAIVEIGTKVISSNAFASVSLDHIQIPEGLVCIENYAFHASTLAEIALPKSFRILESQAFYEAELASITVASTNPYFVSIDGILYRHDKSFIEYWPEKKQVEDLYLPQGMVILDGAKINNIHTIKTLTIPKSLISCSNMSKNQLVSIQVDDNNPYLALFDGVLYPNDFSCIYVYPNQNKQTVIKIHDNIETFPMELFDTVNTTQALKLPKNLKVMEGYKYSGLLGGFRNLSVLELDKSNAYYTLKDGILYDKAMTKIILFPIDLDIKSYTIPETVTLIDNGQLRRQNHLQKLYVHKNCQLANAQVNLYTLCDITLGKECFELEAVIIEEGNPYFKSVDGVVFHSDKNVLFLYPCAKKDKKYQIPDKIDVADFNAYNPYLEEIIFSKSLRGLFGVSYDEDVFLSLGEGKAFPLFPKLKRITLNGNDNFEIRDNILYRVGSWSDAWPSENYQVYSFKADYSLFVKEYLDSNRVMNNSTLKEVQFSVETKESKQKPENLVEGYVFSKDNTIKYKNEKVATIQDVSLFTTFHYDTIFDKVEKVIIAEGVTSLPASIFYYFPKVKVISLPKSLNNVGKAFYFIDFDSMVRALYAGETFPYYLSNLQEVKVHPQNSYYTDINGILYNRDVTNLICYPSNKLDKTYVMPESLTSIETSAFGANYRLQRIEINALFRFNSGYMYSGFSSYGFLSNLTYFKVDENNLYICTVDGVLYDKAMNTLIEYPQGKVTKIYHIPETVTNIESSALYGVQMEELMLPRELYLNTNCLEYSKIGHILDNDYTDFRVIDGVIYDRDIKYLIYWPNQKKVKNLTFPSTLQSCSFKSISNLDCVESITIPRDLKSFGITMKMENLKTIYVEEGNKYFTLYDGILYNKALTNLYLMPCISSISTIHVPANYKGCYMRDLQNKMFNVTKIIIEGSGLYFPYECFPDLKEFELAKGNKKASVMEGVLYNASKSTLMWYPQNKKTKTFTVPFSVTSFRKNTFEVHNYLESITLSDKLSLKLDYDSSLFSNCKKLIEIKVSSKNPNLTAIDGVLYTKDKKTLLIYPMGKTAKEYTVLESATKVFLNQNRYLKTLNIGSKVTSIEGLYKYHGLQGFTALESIQVSNKNSYYFSNDGVVYHEDEMVFYPSAKKAGSFVVPSKVVSLDNLYLLRNHRYLKNILCDGYRFRIYGTNLIEQ